MDTTGLRSRQNPAQVDLDARARAASQASEVGLAELVVLGAVGGERLADDAVGDPAG
jgi:hypothetical protein